MGAFQRSRRLGKLDANPAPSVLGLIDALQDVDNELVRANAACTLGQMDHRIWQGLVLRKAVCIVWILRVVASYPEVVAERAVDLWMDRSVPRLCARTRRSSRIQVVLCHVACLPKVPTKPTAASTRSTCLADECICLEIDQEGDRNLGISDWGKPHNDT